MGTAPWIALICILFSTKMSWLVKEPLTCDSGWYPTQSLESILQIPSFIQSFHTYGKLNYHCTDLYDTATCVDSSEIMVLKRDLILLLNATLQLSPSTYDPVVKDLHTHLFGSVRLHKCFINLFCLAMQKIGLCFFIVFTSQPELNILLTELRL